jgi:hypothetical protein
MDLFDNPVGYLTSLGKMLCILLFFSDCCLKTEVFKQLYYKSRGSVILPVIADAAAMAGDPK